MCSIHNTRKIILLAIGAITLCGCASANRHESAPVAVVDPVAPDEAMLKRDWSPAIAAYPNGSVAAGPTEFRYEPKRGMPEWRYAFADSGTFFANMLMLPYNIIKHPLGGVKIAKGETVPPSYTAMPVLPPPMVYQPTTPPVLEPGASPTTPPVVEPPTPGTDVTPAAPPAGELPPTPPAEPTPPVNVVPAPAAPAETIPSIAPQPGTSPTPVVSPTTDTIPTIAPPVPEVTAPAPTPPVAPTPAPNITISPGVAPTTPPVIEPPPPEATRNLAPPIHPAQDSAPTTQPDLNK